MPKTQRIIGVIPARYGSSRFPGKVLKEINGKPMIQWVYEQANKSQILDDLFVAVDNSEVFNCVASFGGNAIMTKSDHQSGTDRVAEVLESINTDIVVNIQGDQPLLDSKMIDEATQPLLEDRSIQMSTLKIKIEQEDYSNPSVVKVVVDEDDFALYFSRSLIPFSRDKNDEEIYEHVGLYVYRKDFLLAISKMSQTYLEKTEMLEQLRVLEKGFKIKVIETKCNRLSGISVDTLEDLKKVEKIIKKLKLI